MTIRPRRSVLYMPGSNARALEKAKSLPADGVILDLEDSVAPDAKEAARDRVAAAVKAGGFGSREVIIRVNGVDTPWHADDLSAAAHAAPDAILVPKISNAETLELIGRRLLDMGTPHKTRIWAMIETPLAIFNILSIAAEARDSEARLAGFDGKTLIHPSQIEACNAAFSPSADEVAQARKMIAAFELPENKGKGVVSIDGRMVERLHAEMAKRMVMIAEAIGGQG